MLKIENSVCVEASSEVVWKALADLEKVSVWAEPIVEAHCHGDTVGVGSLRVCKLKGNMNIKERWIEWNEGESYSYVAEGMPLIKYAENTWTVEGVNGMCLVKSCAEFTFKGGFFGRLLEFPMGIMMRKMGPQALAGFKYWVENGKPYRGNISKIPIAPVSC